MTNTTDIINSGITSTSQQEITIDDLAPNNYLTIIWKDTKTDKVYNTMDIAQDEAIEYTNAINASIENAINNNTITYVGQNRFINIESIAKYIAQNKIKDSTRRRIANALIGLASGDPSKLTENSINLLINVFGEIVNKTARELGYTDPHQVFSQITGQNVINTFKTLGAKTKDFIDDFTSRINKTSKTDLSNTNRNDRVKRYVGLILGLTTSDTESYEITIPRKKVEDGSDYTTHFINQPFKKDFTVKLTNKVVSPNYSRIDEINSIEAIKDKLIEISQSHTLFDIYIRLSNEKVYKRENVFFTSLSFAKDEDSGNGYTCTFSLSPVGSFKSKIFVSDRVYGVTKGVGVKNGNNKSDKTNTGDSLKIGYIGSKKEDVFNSLKEAKSFASKHEYYILYSPNFSPEYKFIPRDQVFDYKGVLYRMSDTYFNISGRSDFQEYQKKRLPKRGVVANNKKKSVIKNMVTVNGKYQYYIIRV